MLYGLKNMLYSAEYIHQHSSTVSNLSTYWKVFKFFAYDDKRRLLQWVNAKKTFPIISHGLCRCTEQQSHEYMCGKFLHSTIASTGLQ